MIISNWVCKYFHRRPRMKFSSSFIPRYALKWAQRAADAPRNMFQRNGVWIQICIKICRWQDGYTLLLFLIKINPRHFTFLGQCMGDVKWFNYREREIHQISHNWPWAWWRSLSLSLCHKFTSFFASTFFLSSLHTLDGIPIHPSTFLKFCFNLQMYIPDTFGNGKPGHFHLPVL